MTAMVLECRLATINDLASLFRLRGVDSHCRGSNVKCCGNDSPKHEGNVLGFQSLKEETVEEPTMRARSGRSALAISAFFQ